MNENILYSANFNGERIGERVETLKEAQELIASHPSYKKTRFTKKGDASSNNPNRKEWFAIYDNMGGRWSIRNK